VTRRSTSNSTFESIPSVGNVVEPANHRSSSGRRGQKSSQPRHLESSMRQQSHQTIFAYDKSHHFDMTQVQNAISLVATEHTEGSRSRLATGSNGDGSYTTTEPGVKKERIKNLWGKAGKQGIMLQSVKQPPSGQFPTKWDQVLNPLIQKQRHAQAVPAGGPGGSTSSGYYNTTVGGEAGGGSGFYGQPGNATMECDCGDDSCPQCNLMLNMGSGF
jgi:hypothetical protein